MTEAPEQPPAETEESGRGEQILTEWKFRGKPPTEAQVRKLLETLPPVHGIEHKDYFDFVQALPSREKVYTQNPDPTKTALVEEYLDVWTLYMSVAGRQAMLNAAQELNDWRVDIEPEPSVVPPGYLDFTDKLVYRVTIKIWHAPEDGPGLYLGVRHGTAWVPPPGEKRKQAAASNPYEKCLVPGTRVLTADLRWVAVEQLAIGDELLGFDEDPAGRGVGQRFRRALVEDTKPLRRDCVTIWAGPVSVTCSIDHQWLTSRPGTWRRWVAADQLKPGDRIVSVGAPWPPADTRDAGWLAGFLDGEGHIGNGIVRFTQRKGAVLEEACRILDRLGLSYALNTEQRPDGRDIVRGWITGGVGGQLRALGMLRPVRLGLRADEVWAGRRSFGRALRWAEVESVCPTGVRDVIAMQTTTRTFIAEGLFSHNCETSALGRALGGWGFGVFPGSGIASVEEMQQIRENREYLQALQTGQAPRPRRSREELLQDVVAVNERLRQALGWDQEQADRAVGKFVTDRLKVARAFDPATGIIDWDQLRDGHLDLLLNALKEQLRKAQAVDDPLGGAG